MSHEMEAMGMYTAALMAGGYTLWDVSSIAEAVEWAERSPVTTGSEFEIRSLFSMKDFPQWKNPG
jgi:hypothetical protein